MKKAFTLVELLVVIAIIGVLASTLIVTFGSGTDSARATKCITGMRNLANGVTAYAMDKGYYPLAGSVERYGVDESQGIKNVKESYNELPGWISWFSDNAYRAKPASHVSSANWFVSAYEQDVDKRLYCLTNGALWKYVSKNADIYVCPMHVRKMPPRQKPAWSYVMNAAFGYDDTFGAGSKSQHFAGTRFGTLKRADRTLLFAEIPWAPNYTVPHPEYDDMPGVKNDCTLHYLSPEEEQIGFCHKDGRRWVAHVVFADGHVEKIHQPQGGLDVRQAKDLTRLLCTGKDYTLSGSTYEELK